MDSTAINAIRDLAHAERANEILANRSVSQHVVVPSNYTLADLEKFDSAPNRFRGKFATESLDAFSEYVNANAADGTGLFVNPEQSKAHAIIDLGTHTDPEWGSHTADLQLKKTPEFSALLNLNGQTLNQQDMIDFAEDWFLHTEFIDASGDRIDFRPAINAIRKLTVSSTQNNEQAIGNFNASSSSLDAIEIKANGDIPPFGFNFTCSPYESFSARTLTCQLRAITDGKQVHLKFRISHLDGVINEIGQEFRSVLQEKVKLNADRFYIGTLNYQ